MTVGIAGDGPAAATVRAALGDAGADVEAVAPGDAGSVELAVVVGDGFAAANDAALAAGTTWLAVELGGVGDREVPGVAAAVSGFGPATGCYECLRARVAANAAGVGDDGGTAAADGTSDGAGAGSEEEPADDGGTADGGATAADARLAGAVAGREAVALHSGGSTRMPGAVVEVPHAARRFLPVPGCPACGDGRDRTLSRAAVDSDLDDALERAERALDDRVGLVSTVGEVDSYPAPYYLARLADTSGFSDARAAGQAAGVATEWDAAFMKALGEAMERYAAGVYRAAEFETAPPAAVEGAVPPAAFVRPDDRPAPGPDDPVQWVAGYRLTDGAPARLPAAFVHYPPPDERYAPPITTGLGLGRSPVAALLSGLYEVVERDATMLAWYSTYEPLALSVDDEGFETLARRAGGEGLSVTPLLVTQDVDVPAVTVAVHRDGEWPAFAVGSAADLDAAAAARGALAEAVQNWMELRSMGRREASAEEPHVARYASLPPAAASLLDADGRVPADSVGPDRVPDGETELDAVVERVAAADLTPYAARVTTRDLESIGFEAVRVVVPSAQPLFAGDAFFGERAGSVPASLGFEPRPDREHHPYP